VAVVHVTEARGAAVVWSRAHICVMPLVATQDATAPLGALLVGMVSAILLALTAIKALLALAPPVIVCMFIAPLLSYASNGGVIDEGGADSMTITPCHSSNVAVAGTVVVMCHGSKGPWLEVSVNVTCSAQVLSIITM
jgi:hypothetical protein